MKPVGRTTRGQPPVKFEVHAEGDPHELMSTRKEKSEQIHQKSSKRRKAAEEKVGGNY